jgi:glycosyltransferase involved in cell wall biosynthesis
VHPRAPTAPDRAVNRPDLLPAISVIVPVYNGAAVLERCLAALAASQGPSWECIVADDGSDDRSAEIARVRGARVIQVGRSPLGPAAARNAAARLARAPLLCFLDADVAVHPNTLAAFVELFEHEPDLAAAFGSYDARPAEPGLVSQYRNLLHHFVHQHGREQAVTFWAGCGAIRREVFETLGGFDPLWRRPSVEDIELGYRLVAAGQRIRLARQIQVTHLKRWTFWGMVRTDIFDRALPWTALIVRAGQLPNDLNVGWSSRLSALSVYALAGLLGLGWRRRPAWLAALVPLGALLAFNRDFYAFLWQQRGPWFLIRALPLHWLYYAYSSLAFGAGVLLTRLAARLPPALSGSRGAKWADRCC